MNVVYSYNAFETSNKHYSIKKCALILNITIIIDHVEDHQHKNMHQQHQEKSFQKSQLVMIITIAFGKR